MVIGYRRFGSSLGITEQEDYKIGGWHEKRLALVETLRNRGHEVLWCTKPTKYSKGLWDYEKNMGRKLDLLLVEIGQQNLFFKQGYIIPTVEMINSCECPVVFLYDDPDIIVSLGNPTSKEKVPDLELIIKKADVWANCELNDLNVQFIKEKLFYKHKSEMNIPELSVASFPFSGLQDVGSIATPSINKAIYLGGTSDGRKKLLDYLRGRKNIDIINDKDFYPSQPERLTFYSKYAANLGIVGRKHKNFQWYTGRIFHASRAGTVTFVEQDNFLSKYFPVIDELTIENDIEYNFNSQERREFLFSSHLKLISQFKYNINNLFEKYGI